MRTVIVKLPGSADFSTALQEMRSWLDARGCAPSRFTYDVLPDFVILRVEFARDQEADSFKRQFGGIESEFVNPGRPQMRETMEQVCWWRLTAEEIRAEAGQFACRSARDTMAQVALSYDCMAQDLEKRLADPRYRHGLVVGCASFSIAIAEVQRSNH
jgi:hypothetical protein